MLLALDPGGSSVLTKADALFTCQSQQYQMIIIAQVKVGSSPPQADLARHVLNPDAVSASMDS